MAANSPPPPSPSHLPPVPASPTYSYASTANPLSQYNLPLPPPPRPVHAVLTKADLESSQTAYGDLIASAKAYRLALATLSTAASAFGSALESCARLKEARADALGPAATGASLSNSFSAKGTCTADTLLTVAGLQHLVANHQQILSETVYRSFEVPLLDELDRWRATMEDEDEVYTRAVKGQSKEIRRLEKEGLKLHRQRRRDVSKFRSHLVELTTKLDGLTALHGDHARNLLRESQDTSVRIVDASCSLVRAEIDIFESLAKKGWTGGGLEDVLEKGVDLFASEDAAAAAAASGHGGSGPGGSGSSNGELFSILPPRSILADSGSDVTRSGGGGGGGGHARADSLLMETDRYQSLAGAVSDSAVKERDRDTDSVFSEFNRSRGVRPFSPQPQRLRLNPEDLLVSLDNGSGGGPPPPPRSTSLDDEASPVDDAPPKKEAEEAAADFHTRLDSDPVPEESGEDDDEDDEHHPWRNEGIARSSGGEDDADALDPTPDAARRKTLRWSDHDDGLA